MLYNIIYNKADVTKNTIFFHIFLTEMGKIYFQLNIQGKNVWISFALKIAIDNLINLLVSQIGKHQKLGR